MRHLLLTFAAFALLPSLVLAEGRYALVFGTESYDYIRDLANPVEDATAIAALLRDLGFNVTLETDRNAKRTRRALEDFAEDAEGADLALVYYAGHGVELRGSNHLLPTDTEADTPEALADSTVPLSEVVATVRAIAPAAILIVDACRDDPFIGTQLEGQGRGAADLDGSAPQDSAEDTIAPGFARLGRADGLVYAFSTAPSDTASDGDGEHSPFTESLLRHLAKPGLELRTVLTLVSQDVYDRTRTAQLPYFESALPDVVFVAGQPAEISERDALLLAMAGLGDETRAEVEELAAARDMPLAPLYAALLTLDPTRTSREDQTRALMESAEAYAAFQQNLLTLSPTDPRVEELRAAAATDLDLGQSIAAQNKFDQAIAIDQAAIGALSEVILPRYLSQAETLILSADAARADLNHAKAIATLTEVATVYAKAAVLGLPPEAQTKRTASLWDLGELHELTGDIASALATYRTWNTIAQALADATPEDAALQGDLSLSHELIGNILTTQGNLDAALANYRVGMAIREVLAAQNPGNTTWQRDLSISHDNIGDIMAAQGDLDAALASYRVGLAIREVLSAQDPGNAEWQRGLWVSHIKIGDILNAQGDLDTALASYRAGLAISEVLAARDPSSADWQLDLSTSHIKIGNILTDQGDLDAALASYRVGLAIREVLAAKDPGNATWQRDLSISHQKIGHILTAQGDLDAALASYRVVLEIREVLAAQDPDNAIWQRDISVIHSNIGDVLTAQGNLNTALASYRAGLAISEVLAAQGPGNAEWQRDLSLSHEKIGDILTAQGNLDAALASYRTSLAIREVLAAQNNGSVEAELDLVVSHYKLSTVKQGSRPDLEAALAILLKLQAEGRLPPVNEEWIEIMEKALAALPSP